MTEVVRARIDQGRLIKLEAIKARTGFNTSQLFRQFIDAVEVEPAKFTVQVGQAKSDAIRQDSHVAFAG